MFVLAYVLPVVVVTVLMLAFVEYLSRSQKRYLYTPVVRMTACDEWGTEVHSKHYSQSEMDRSHYLMFHRNAYRDGLTVKTTWLAR